MARLLSTCLLVTGLWLIATAAHAQQAILIDFGSSDRRGGDAWNNVTQPRETGRVLPQAIDALGDWTTVSLTLLDAFAGVNRNGYDGDEGPFPAFATSDSFYLGDGDIREARLRLDGLSADQRYTFTFYASRVGGVLPRRTTYRVGTESVDLDAADNQTRQATVSVQPDLDGSLTIDVQCAEQQGYGYLGVLKIEGNFTSAERLREPADQPDGPPLVTAQSWAIADAKTGELLWGDNEESPRHMASITKVMTAHLALELVGDEPAILDEIATVSHRAANTPGSSAKLKVGERLAVSDLLYAVLLPSGNDAAMVVAEHFNERFPPLNEDAKADDSTARFIAAMNARAAELGMAQTRYFDPHGNSANRSTAGDLMRLAFRALRDERFRQYVNTSHHRARVTMPDGSQREAVWKSTNRLLGIEGYDGVKTGTTSGAGSCLLSSSRRGDRHLLTVVLGSTSNESRYVDTRNLFRWAWREIELSE